MHEELAKLATERPFSFRVKAIPRSARTEVAGKLADGTIKIKVAAVPDKGKANAELRAFLAREFGVSLSHVEIVAGRTSPLKVVRVSP
jgi:uncharacterized protein (TIGR00251 family)